jgi:hypothetical protein
MEIIILGMGPSRADCPFDAEVWGVNNGYRQVIELKGHLDKLFICHRDQEWDWEGDPIFSWDEQNILANEGVEIVSLFKLKHVKKFTQLPYKKIVKHFGTEYFSDSIAYMLAYALYLNTKIDKTTGLLKLIEPMKIRMYGVDMFTKDEYATERGGIEYFIAVARTLGVDFWIHPDSAVCKTDSGKPYGFFKLNKKKTDPLNIMELQKSVKGLRKMLKKGLITLEQFNGMSAVICKTTS